MLQALRGAEDAALKAGGCHRHGHVGVERSYCPQPLVAVAHALEALPELRPRYAIVGLFEVNKTGPQLAAAALPPSPRVPPLWLLTAGAAAAALPLLPVALDDRAQGQGSLLGAALPAEAELALCVQACRLCVSRHAALKPSCEQLGQQGADRYAPQVARLGLLVFATSAMALWASPRGRRPPSFRHSPAAPLPPPPSPLMAYAWCTRMPLLVPLLIVLSLLGYVSHFATSAMALWASPRGRRPPSFRHSPAAPLPPPPSPLMAYAWCTRMPLLVPLLIVLSLLGYVSHNTLPPVSCFLRNRCMHGWQFNSCHVQCYTCLCSAREPQGPAQL